MLFLLNLCKNLNLCTSYIKKNNECFLIRAIEQILSYVGYFVLYNTLVDPCHLIGESRVSIYLLHSMVYVIFRAIRFYLPYIFFRRIRTILK